MNNISKDMMSKLSIFKMELVINKNLFNDEVISKDMYEIVQNKLLEKIKNISNQLEFAAWYILYMK